MWFEVGEDGMVGSSEGRDEPAPALIAALSINAKGGLIPHVRHGGIGNESVATEGSKLEGTGFVKVQMGQIQLADFVTGAALDTELGRNGLEEREPGDEEDC